MPCRTKLVHPTRGPELEKASLFHWDIAENNQNWKHTQVHRRPRAHMLMIHLCMCICTIGHTNMYILILHLDFGNVIYSYVLEI